MRRELIRLTQFFHEKKRYFLKFQYPKGRHMIIIKWIRTGHGLFPGNLKKKCIRDNIYCESVKI